jgi:tetratricopeptide (TPR) repeat protein
MNASQSWWQLVQEALQQQNWPVAEGALRRLLQDSPDHLELLDLLGYALLMQGCFAESEAQLRKAMARSAQSFWTPHKLGDALRGQQRMQEAVECYEQALSWGSDSPLTVRNLLQVLDGLSTERALCRLAGLADEGGSTWQEGAIEAALQSPSPQLAFSLCQLGCVHGDVRAKAYMQALSELDLIGLQGLLEVGNDSFSFALQQRLSSLMEPVCLPVRVPLLQEVVALKGGGFAEHSCEKFD